jgi:hypothetical protein
MADRKPATAEELAGMAASYRSQAGWLTRAVATCNSVVAEAMHAQGSQLSVDGTTGEMSGQSPGSRGKVCCDL